MTITNAKLPAPEIGLTAAGTVKYWLLGLEKRITL